MVPKPSRGRRAARQRGFVLVTMAITTVSVLGVVGLAIDVGRIFVVKNETQVYCDAAALAAALALDGTAAGITRAQTAVTNSTNGYNFGTSAVPSPAVTFASSAAGPWAGSPSSGSGYTYVRVAASVPVQLYFLPLLGDPGTFTVVSAATAGQIAVSSLRQGVAPYTAVSTNPTGPAFGFIAGNSYDIQWPNYNGSKAGCGPANPDKCFNSPPCSGDPLASKVAVVTNWGAKFSGYWGGSANSDIAAEIMDAIQLSPVAVGTNMYPLLTAGNKASEAGYLDQRASQDTDTSSNTYSSYLASTTRNGRRLIAVTIVDPVDAATTTVTGFGQFLLMANGSPSSYYTKNTNGNDPYCAIYMGPYNIGSTGPGAGGTTGASIARLIQ